MTAPHKFTQEEIAGELETAKFIEYPSNVKTLAAIVVQLQQESAKDVREHLESLTERDHFEDAITKAARALGCEDEWSNAHDHAKCVVQLAEEASAEIRDLKAQWKSLEELSSEQAKDVLELCRSYSMNGAEALRYPDIESIASFIWRVVSMNRKEVDAKLNAEYLARRFVLPQAEKMT